MKILFVLLLLAAPALAGNEPWSVGVTDAQKQAAQALLEQGNALFLEKKFSAALEKYNAATA